MRFYFLDGSPELDIEENKLLLSNFLGGDIQGCNYTVNMNIDMCNKVKTGELPVWEGTGNTFTVYIKPDGVLLYNECTESECQLSSVEEFEWYLTQWKRLLDTREELIIDSPYD
ncbi:TPA: hypothetical protein ACSP1O_004163 [Aeromonas veronii]